MANRSAFYRLYHYGITWLPAVEKRIILNKKQKIIVVTGAESTGKSTLTKQLAREFNARFIPEFARDYIENLQLKYDYADVEKIAKQQILALDNKIEKQTSLIILDTWLIITKVWFEMVFNKEPSWLEENIHAYHIDLFLVCDTDLPWIPDRVRENGGIKRLELQKRYIELLKEYNFNFALVSGNNIDRLSAAKSKVQEILAEP